MSRRALITVDRSAVTKTYSDLAQARAEVDWYRRVPWATPELLDADLDRGVLVIARHRSAADHREDRPAGELAELLRRLEAAGVHHRDVHVGNVVLTGDGPRLIDWETATSADAPSYDLHGPEASGVPVPKIHTDLGTGYRMWWGAAHRMSIRSRWGCDVPPVSAALG
ncbi:phosphotransferase [Nocardia rhizosphaerae]|uniref:Phosphotransferase n=1 Tax=Nocardia rhizosphaerae TaxID=1691571 RepID=A0ABV8L2D8_9NOCA